MPPPRSPSDLCVCLVGPLPPARGGVSIHVQRLAAGLTAAGARVVVAANNGGDAVPPEVTVREVPPGRMLAPAVLRVARAEAPDLLHFHTFGGSWKGMAAWVAVRKVTGLPVVVSQHSLRADIDALSARELWLTRTCVDGLSRTVASGRPVYDKLMRLGVSPDRVVEISPFIAPEPLVPADVHFPPDIQRVMDEARETGGPLVVAGAGRLVDIDGGDLYGLDLFVRAAGHTLRARPQARFVYLLSEPGNARLLAEARAWLRQAGLEDRVCVHIGALAATAMWAAGDVFIRPTLSDGDALSIREAMLLGVPTLASDAVPRPPGCLTYRSRDPADCARRILEMAGDLPAARARVARHPSTGAVGPLLDVYRRVLGEQARAARALSRLAFGPRRRRPDPSPPFAP